MPTHIRLTKNGVPLGQCGPRCYNAKGGKCNCICEGANHARGETHAIQTAELLKRTLEVKYAQPGHKITFTQTETTRCLFPPDTDSSSDSTPQEI